MNGVFADVCKFRLVILPVDSTVYAVLCCENVRVEVQPDGVWLAVVFAGIAFGRVFVGVDSVADAVRMRDLRVAVRALAGDFDRVAARLAGGGGQLRAGLVVVGETPACNPFTGGIERHGIAGAGIGVLFVEGHPVAEVAPFDSDGRRALHSLEAGPFESEVDGVGPGVGEHGPR